LKEIALIPRFSSKNWYSFAPLLASLENTSIIQNLDICIPQKWNDSILKNIITKYNLIIFAYSFYTHETPKIFAELQHIKEKFSLSKLIFIAGGPHPSGNPQQTLRLGFDIVVKGEGERIFPELLDYLLKHRNLEDMNGIFYRENDRLCISESAPLLNLDEYPTFSQRFNLYPPIEITRGCPFGCKYCEVSYLFGRQIRHRGIETILKIVKAYQKIFAGKRSTDIRFISPNALAYGSRDGRSPNYSKIVKLLQNIAKLDNIRIFFATFPSETRPEFIKESILREIVPYLSNKYIAFGAQSGSDAILQQIGRQHNVEDIRNAVTTILDVGLIPLVDFILGLPGEKIEDQYQTLDLIRELIQNKAEIRIHYFMPLAGTPFETASPVPIDPTILSELGRFAKKGYLQGNLDVQIKNSNQIVKFQQFLEKEGFI